MDVLKVKYQVNRDSKGRPHKAKGSKFSRIFVPQNQFAKAFADLAGREHLVLEEIRLINNRLNLRIVLEDDAGALEHWNPNNEPAFQQQAH